MPSFFYLERKTAPVGAELRGTGTRPGAAWRPVPERPRLLLGPAADVEGSSCANPPSTPSVASRSIPGCLCVSTAGARPNPRWLAPLIRQGRPVYCGFDADPAGESMARAMTALYPAIQRLRPPLHDWNDVLRSAV